MWNPQEYCPQYCPVIGQWIVSVLFLSEGGKLYTLQKREKVQDAGDIFCV